MAQKIKGVSGSIPAWTLWRDCRAGKRDGKNKRLFDGVTNTRDPKKSTEAYCAIPWIAEKVACYNRHCHQLYQNALQKLEPVVESVDKEKVSFDNKVASLEVESQHSVDEQTPGLVAALEQEIKALRVKAGGQKGEIDNIEILLKAQMEESREELSKHINRYRSGVKGLLLPKFAPEELPAPVDKEMYGKLIEEARKNIQSIVG